MGTSRVLGNGKQTKHQARIIGSVLHCDVGMIDLFDTPSFTAWLESHDAFYVEDMGEWDAHASFTARKEIRSGTAHWYAYTRVLGTLYKRYIGQTDMVTCRRLICVSRDIPTTKVSKA